MNYTCGKYITPTNQSSIYIGGVLIVNHKPFKPVSSSLYLSHKTDDCYVIDNYKHNSYQRYLNKKKRS